MTGNRFALRSLLVFFSIVIVLMCLIAQSRFQYDSSVVKIAEAGGRFREINARTDGIESLLPLRFRSNVYGELFFYGGRFGELEEQAWKRLHGLHSVVFYQTELNATRKFPPNLESVAFIEMNCDGDAIQNFSQLKGLLFLKLYNTPAALSDLQYLLDQTNATITVYGTQLKKGDLQTLKDAYGSRFRCTSSCLPETEKTIRNTLSLYRHPLAIHNEKKQKGHSKLSD